MLHDATTLRNTPESPLITLPEFVDLLADYKAAGARGDLAEAGRLAAELVAGALDRQAQRGGPSPDALADHLAKPTPETAARLVDDAFDRHLEDEQLPLPLRAVPAKVREFGLQEAHTFPYVSHGKGKHVARRPALVAWRRWEEIELRTPNSYPALILDVDTSVMECLDVAMGSSKVRVPNWIAFNPATGHAHVVYTLARPVLCGDGMRLAPMQFHARIAEYYREQYKADSGYTGVLTHNPVHRKWETEWLRETPWTLPELAEPMPKRWRIPAKPTTPEGRNVTLFNAALRWFGRPSNWDASTDLGDVLAWVEDACSEWFGDNPIDWHRNECMSIAKSVTRYCRRNLASGQTQRQFPLIQAYKGKLSGKERRQGTPLEHDRTPWETEGISRAWWYRKRQRQRSRVD